jgi:glycosyltransferase involved in cell wall biosynthesis
MAGVTFAIIIPVYRNEGSIPTLLDELERVIRRLHAEANAECEVVFVVDGSPDSSEPLLLQMLPTRTFRSRVVTHSRNFGSFAAIRTGLAHADAASYGVMAADLQEPPDLMLDFWRALQDGGHDVAVGVRTARHDPAASTWAARAFWKLYRRFVNREIPEGGVDVFGCSRRIRDLLLNLREANTSLVGQLYWLGFKRAEVAYERRPRIHGRSGWTLSRKLTYMLDSVFAFTDLPIRVLTGIGIACLAASGCLIAAVVALRIAGGYDVPGYAALAVMTLFFGGMNSLGIGIIGAYCWRAYENTKGRPLAIAAAEHVFAGAGARELTKEGRHAA